ncbi:MAG: UvrD-helicase domain-containing protein [Leptospiraceae bacterium]|nr:UvrD-helicase domain-containing protein [Leptospiraceae bacterium]MCP5513376.1 UvrD-helicase domain-containing protein [Leptospiraceae bacterium]
MKSVYIHPLFIESAGKLPQNVYKRIPKFMETLRDDPQNPGLNLHSVEDSMKSSRVYGAKLTDAYRVIVLLSEQKDNSILLYVDHHDKAYNWARNKNFSFQKQDVFQITSQSSDQESATSSENNLSLLWEKYSDKEFFDIGIEKDMVDSIRRIRNRVELISVSRYFDEVTRAILFLLADGVEMNQAFKTVLEEEDLNPSKEEKVNVKTYENIEITNPSLIKFQKEIDWESIFSDSLAKWRVFLHPKQTHVVQRKLSGAFMIKGSAGTGKTVVLLHRIKHILEKIDQPKVLFLCFSSNLSLELRLLLKQLIDKKADRIKINHLYEYSKEICKKMGWDGSVVNSKESGFQKSFDEAYFGMKQELPLSKEELYSEFIDIKEQLGIYSKEDYLSVIRKGKKKMGRLEREKVWAFFELFDYELKKRKLMTAEQTVHNTRMYLENNPDQCFDHVLVDEVQDFTVEGLRLLNTLSQISKSSDNSLTMAGDNHQRIYRINISPIQAGIDIKGKSKALKINYRTSEEIRQFAHSMISNEELIDFDLTSLKSLGDHSEFCGPNPVVHHSGDPEDSYKKLVDEVKNLQKDGILETEICIIYRGKIGEGLVNFLRKNSIRVYEITAGKTDQSDYPGVRIGNIHRIKGLEFKSVILYVYDGSSILSNLNQLSLYDKCELYVASSRARERLVVID